MNLTIISSSFVKDLNSFIERQSPYLPTSGLNQGSTTRSGNGRQEGRRYWDHNGALQHLKPRGIDQGKLVQQDKCCLLPVLQQRHADDLPHTWVVGFLNGAALQVPRSHPQHRSAIPQPPEHLHRGASGDDLGWAPRGKIQVLTLEAERSGAGMRLGCEVEAAVGVR